MNTGDPMDKFIMGAIAMASWVVGLYFFRFWRETRDRLFAIFGLSFWLLGLTRLGLVYSEKVTEGHTIYYVVRLIAYLLILIAILDKNQFWLRLPGLGTNKKESTANPEDGRG
jgi:hypothetical protein